MPANFLNCIEEYFPNRKFTINNTVTGVETKARVLEWANCPTHEPFFFLDIHQLTDAWELQPGHQLHLQLNTATRQFQGTFLDQNGQLILPVMQPLPADPLQIELIEPQTFNLRYDPTRQHRQPLPRSFIEQAGLQNTQYLHLKIQHCTERWIVQLTRRRPPGFIYEMTKGWQEFVHQCPLIQPGCTYKVRSKTSDNFTLVFDI